MLKLSIVIPVYNVEAYLAKCLDSLIYPGIDDYEILIVNDGSTDSSGDIAADYAARYPSLIRLVNKSNGGLGSARNAGIEAARGEFLLFVDSDDWLCENALPEIMEKLKEDFDICIFGILSVTEAGTVLDDVISCGREGKFSLAEYPQLLMAPPSACNKLCRRSLFIDSGIRFPAQVWYEDLRTMPKLYLHTDKIVATNRQWYVYLQRPGSIINSANPERNLEIIDAVEDLCDYYRQQGQFERWQEELEYISFYNRYLTASIRVCLAQPGSPVLEELVGRFLREYPEYKHNKYVSGMPIKYKLLSFLLRNRMYSAVGFIMGLNNKLKGKHETAHIAQAKKSAVRTADSRTPECIKADTPPTIQAVTELSSAPVILSIIIPVYNVQDYIAKCLDSVIAPGIEQISRGDQPSYEIIVVNDGTPDRSAEIAAQYVQRLPELIKLINIENSGQGQARNVGIDASRGEYLYFLDSDDYLTDGGIVRLMELCRQDFDICIFDSISVNVDGHEIKYMPGCERLENISLREYPELLLAPPSACNKICRRTLFTDNGLRFTPKVWFEDLRTIPKLYAFTDSIVYVPQALHRYLQRSGSVTNTQDVLRNLEIIPAMDDLIDFYKEQGRWDDLKNVLEYLAFHSQFLTSSVRANLADPKSPVQEELMLDFLCKFPDYRENPYVKTMSRQHKLLDSLLRHRMFFCVHAIMKANNLLKNKKV